MAFEYRMKQGKATGVLSRECIGHSKHHLPTTQEKTLYVDNTRWSTLESELIIFFAVTDGEVLYSPQKTRLGADCGLIMNTLMPNSDLN